VIRRTCTTPMIVGKFLMLSSYYYYHYLYYYYSCCFHYYHLCMSVSIQWIHSVYYIDCLDTDGYSWPRAVCPVDHRTSKHRCMRLSFKTWTCFWCYIQCIHLASAWRCSPPLECLGRRKQLHFHFLSLIHHHNYYFTIRSTLTSTTVPWAWVFLTMR
jgi:hypothetical protein